MKSSVLDTPNRHQKPRNFGLTSMYDIGMPLVLTKGYLEDFADYFDVAKLAVGTGYVMPRVQEKVELYKSFGIKVQMGGTLFEKFYSQGRHREYVKFIKERGIDVLEISDGTIDVPKDVVFDMIKEGKDAGLTVFVEFGSKDPEKIIPPTVWVSEISSLLEAGSDYVITESRDSGSAGVFRPSGEIRTGLIEDLATLIDVEKLIFEAPTPKAQMYFINSIGPNVNLANVKPNDILVLEAQRIGIRYETFHIMDKYGK